tara:strand:+ start:6333 stop:6791 length:459 start_codon:yes stop_codon:yes gene_type:complete
MTNKRYWDQLKTTDPRFTKKINKGFGELTTIDPMYQIMKMTEVFGPCGIGWGWDCKYTYTDSMVFAEVTIWLDCKSQNYGPVSSVQSLHKSNGKLDDECTKKAMTDALTKALSHVGVSADVFLGMHDNSKYVEKVKADIKSNVDKSKVKEVI